jgi:hypothetical protein
MNASRRLIYGILITVAVGSALGRILSTQLVFEPSIHRDEKNSNDRRRLWPKVRPAQMPTFSSNDRSRWATVRALVDDGTYVIGRRSRAIVVESGVAPLGNLDPLAAAVTVQAGYYSRTGSDGGIIFEDGWQSVDKVLQPAKLEFYSSKPPLLSTLIAGLYWLLKTLFGWTFTAHTGAPAHPDAIVRTVLVLVNLVPFLIYLQQLTRLAESFSRTDWGRLFVAAAAAFGTLVTPFLITLNNHTIATYCVLFALVSVLEIWRRAPRALGGCADQALSCPWQHHVAAGFFASFAVCNELPALSFAAAVFLLLLLWSPRRALLLFLGAALLPVLAFFWTNYAAVGQLRPAYSEFGGPWYEYEGSHWRKPFPGQTRTGIDFARLQESRGTYVLHLLIGHHGLFSLTPLWLLAIVPMVGGLWHLKKNWQNARQPEAVDRRPEMGGRKSEGGRPISGLRPPGLPWFLAPLTLGLTVVVISFYALRSDNYGGFTNGLRWLMWLTPLWLLCLLPSADRLGTSRWGRGLAYLCLAISVLSANYSPWNPWRHPWLYDFFVALGWPGY